MEHMLTIHYKFFLKIKLILIFFGVKIRTNINFKPI